MSFTPGPWYAEQPAQGFSSLRSVADNRLVFALAHPTPACGDPDVSNEEKYANLALLAAAPDLLEACEIALKSMEMGATLGMSILRQAIAKATQ